MASELSQAIESELSSRSSLQLESFDVESASFSLLVSDSSGAGSIVFSLRRKLRNPVWMIQPTSAYSILSLSGSVRANAPHATVAIADRGVYTPTVGFFVPRAKSRSVCNFMGSNPKVSEHLGVLNIGLKKIY
eukprot:1181466-Prorocentrum_minimum.AAC.4